MRFGRELIIRQSAYDVIVVGGGGSGLACAARCVEHGLQTVVLEKRPQLGGTTGIAVGSFTANGTRHQQQRGIIDSPRQHHADAAKFALPETEALGNGPMREYFLEHTAETLKWLEGLGLRFHGPNPEPPNRVPRMHNVVPNAKAYIAALQSRFLKLGGTVLNNATVESLLKDGDRVIGVDAKTGEQDRTINAHLGVVLAAGDYANNPKMIAQHKGSAFAAVEGINPFATGDGHRMVESVGGQLVNMQITYGPELRFVPPPRDAFTQLLPPNPWLSRMLGALVPIVPRFMVDRMIKRLLVTWQHPEDSLFNDGAILVNKNGQRFCDEQQSLEREIAVASQPDKIAYIVLDRALVEKYSEWPHFISTAPEIAYAYVADYLRLRPDVAIAAPGIDHLATKRNLPADKLIKTVSAETTTECIAPMLRRLDGDRWVLLGPVKAYFTTTEGGAAIDTSLRVLDHKGQPISGLYAIGQNGLGGQILWGHGLHIAWAMTSGRLVGDVLAART